MTWLGSLRLQHGFLARSSAGCSGRAALFEGPVDHTPHHVAEADLKGCCDRFGRIAADRGRLFETGGSDGCAARHAQQGRLEYDSCLRRARRILCTWNFLRFDSSIKSVARVWRDDATTGRRPLFWNDWIGNNCTIAGALSVHSTSA
jgi:hypothetical protein